MPVTGLGLAGESCTQDRETGEDARHSWLKLASAKIDLLLDYKGNHVASVAVTQD